MFLECIEQTLTFFLTEPFPEISMTYFQIRRFAPFDHHISELIKHATGEM